MTARSSVVLPAPLAPSRATISPARKLERDAAQHEHDVLVDDLEVAHARIGPPAARAGSTNVPGILAGLRRFLSSLAIFPDPRAAGETRPLPGCSMNHSVNERQRPSASNSSTNRFENVWPSA